MLVDNMPQVCNAEVETIRNCAEIVRDLKRGLHYVLNEEARVEMEDVMFSLLTSARNLEEMLNAKVHFDYVKSSQAMGNSLKACLDACDVKADK